MTYQSHSKRSHTSDGGSYNVLRRHVHIIVEFFLQEEMQKLEFWAMDLAKRKRIDSLGICDVDYNKTFTKGTLWGALNRFLLLILEYD